MVRKNSKTVDPDLLDIEKLTADQLEALCLLAAGRAKSQISETTGFSMSTLERWVKIPEFKSLLNKALYEKYKGVVAELIIGSKNAVKELDNIISNANTPSKTKVSAINVMLTHASKGKELLIDERLENIEKALEQYGKSSPKA